jgi:ATP-dependent DNA helicase RecQ
MNIRNRAQELLEEMLDSGATFRPGQWEAIEAVVEEKRRVLVVQRTGWGKSLVYFLGTKLLRESGAGPALLISPLLSLMRNQIEMAERIGIRALTINSTNEDEWQIVESALAQGGCDILLISPERLNNERFRHRVLQAVAGRVGLFVVDEVHCISDWGHDFRPDYRRITRILQLLPKSVPVLGTTATANDRVIADVQKQIGQDLLVLRGPLARPTLRLQNIWLPDQISRLAWLAENLPRLTGSGVIYCLTVSDTERVSKWLQSRGIEAAAYHAGDDSKINRETLERALLDNEVKALVATVALGMGFDKPDLGFVVHFQRPGSVVAYYQQVGRAGRAVDRAYGILMSGQEDDEIQDYFITSAFPSSVIMNSILKALESEESLSFYALLSRVNISYSMAEKALKLLEIDGAVGIDYSNRRREYFRTPNPWRPDTEGINRVTDLRRKELTQMQDYIKHTGCLMEYLCKALDDPTAEPCGNCANCQGRGFSTKVKHHLVVEAINFLKHDMLIIPPRKQWPSGLIPNGKRTIQSDHLIMQGRALCDYGDSGWGPMVRTDKYQDNYFQDDLVQAALELIQDHWRPTPSPTWVTAIPSRRRPELVRNFAERLAEALRLPFHAVLIRAKDAPEQKSMANSFMQARNVHDTLALSGRIPSDPVLLVDDIVDSRWTLTLAGWLLRSHGSGPVYPFTLARATARKS